MARLARLYVPEQPQHVILRGLDQQPAFVDDQDYSFIDCLKTASRDHQLAIHAYALTPGAVHLLVTPRDEASLPKAMQAVGGRLSPSTRQQVRGAVAAVIGVAVVGGEVAAAAQPGGLVA